MDSKQLSIDIPVNINMQDYYDNLVLLKSCIDVQIETLSKSPSICIHKKVSNIETKNGIKVTVCDNCHKVIADSRRNVIKSE